VLKYSVLLFLGAFILPLAVHAVVWLSEERPRSWREADWSSAGTLPPPKVGEAALYVMEARTGGLKGIVATHSWIVLKEPSDHAYTRYDVVGWGTPLRRDSQPADGRWYGNDPAILYSAQGAEAERLLPALSAAIETYRWRNRGDYKTWPGPNSNTFVAEILAAIPDIPIALPPTAVGKDYAPGLRVRRTAAGGITLNLGGVLGMTAGFRDGFAISILGLVAGLQFESPALLVPGFGRIEFGGAAGA
jgi:hypothetical protein